MVPVLPPLLSVRLKLGIPEPLAVLSLRPAHLLVSSVTPPLAAQWTPVQRVLALNESHALYGSALHAWCREKGLFEHQLIQWRDAFCAAAQPTAVSAAEQRLANTAGQPDHSALRQRLPHEGRNDAGHHAAPGPGQQGLSDFTAMGKLCVTIAGAAFAHILYHFVLAFSRWEYVEVVEGGESFEALSNGLQNALWQAGGAPREHRTDSLSAAFKNLAEEQDFTMRYTALLDHYALTGTRNNRGVSHENGSVESSHRYLKEATLQALLLRGHRDFGDRCVYEGFVREVVMRRNRRNAAAFRVEREQLQDLPVRRSSDFVEEQAMVTRSGTFTVRAILYSAPSRLIGHMLKVRLYSDRLDCFLSGTVVLTLARGTRAAHSTRGRQLDYRHFISSLKRKPQAFKGLVFRDALFPREAYRRTWEQLELRLTQRQECQAIVALLEMAAHEGIEALLAQRLDALLAAGVLPDEKRLREEFVPRAAEVPVVTVDIPPPSRYDALLPSARGVELEGSAA